MGQALPFLGFRAGSFFRDAAGALAFFQLCTHVFQCPATRLQHDQEVAQPVGRFRNQTLAVVFDRLDDGLDGFLAEFLGAFLEALGQELGCPAAVGVGFGPLGDGFCGVD